MSDRVISPRWMPACACALGLWAMAGCGPGAVANAEDGRAPATVQDAGIAGEAMLPDPFAGQDQVRVGDLFSALAAEIPAAARSPEVRRDFERLFADPAMRGDEALYLDYVRIRLAFEATRAGGLWGIAWQITDQLPQSDRVWAQWRGLSLEEASPLPAVTAIAECDELSALFAFTARALGLSKRSQAGLLWPTPNHTVAVWVVDPGPGARRIVVPTSQIFLDGAQSLGTTAFDPWRQKNIFDYRRADVSPDAPLPAPLARRFLQAVREYGGRPHAELQARRNQREQRQWALLQGQRSP